MDQASASIREADGKITFENQCLIGFTYDLSLILFIHHSQILVGQERKTMHVRNHSIHRCAKNDRSPRFSQLEVPSDKTHTQQAAGGVQDTQQGDHLQLVPTEREDLLTTVHHQFIIIPMDGLHAEGPTGE